MCVGGASRHSKSVRLCVGRSAFAVIALNGEHICVRINLLEREIHGKIFIKNRQSHLDSSTSGWCRKRSPNYAIKFTYFADEWIMRLWCSFACDSIAVCRLDVSVLQGDRWLLFTRLPESAERIEREKEEILRCHSMGFLSMCDTALWWPPALGRGTRERWTRIKSHETHKRQIHA